MTAHVHPKLLALVALLAALTLAACGGDDDSSSDKGGGDAPAASDKAQDRKDMARLIKQAFGPNEQARSGKLDGTIDLEVKGVPALQGPDRDHRERRLRAGQGRRRAGLPDGRRARAQRPRDRRRARGRRRRRLHPARQHGLQAARLDHGEGRRAGGCARQRPCEDGGHVLHPPRPLAEGRPDRRRRGRGRRADRACDGRHPCRALLRGRRQARPAADDAARHGGRRPAAGDHAAPPRRARALGGVRDRRGVGRQGGPRRPQGAPGGQARGRQEGPQDPRRDDLARRSSRRSTSRRSRGRRRSSRPTRWATTTTCRSRSTRSASRSATSWK